MNGENDWDLSAVVKGYNNLNGNSSTQDVHEHINGDFPLPEQSYDPGSDFPNIVTQRRYFGLEEVTECFPSRKKSEITPPTSTPDGVGPTLKPQQPLQTGSPEKGGGLEDERPRNRVKEVSVVEVPVEKVDEWDGWVWRKYGKKKVCDSPFSKSYYRCNYEGNKCPAKKHVQQSQKDENKFIVTYRGKHIHPSPVQSNATKRRKRSRGPAPPAGKDECSFSPPTTNNAS